MRGSFIDRTTRVEKIVCVIFLLKKKKAGKICLFFFYKLKARARRMLVSVKAKLCSFVSVVVATGLTKAVATTTTTTTPLTPGANQLEFKRGRFGI
jgi:hypothetical protein